MSCPRPEQECYEYYCGGNYKGYCQQKPKTEKEQIIDELIMLKNLIEWDMPINYQITIEKAIDLIKSIKE